MHVILQLQGVCTETEMCNRKEMRSNVHKGRADVRKERAGEKADSEEVHNAKYLHKSKDEE